MKNYKQVSQYIHSDLTKLAVIKNSLTGKDKKSVEHLTTVGGVISYIHDKYLKGDIILNLLLKQAYSLSEPWTMANSLKNIEEFLLIISNFYEWKLQSHINSMIPLLFTREQRWKFVEMLQHFEETLTPSSSSASPLALCYGIEKSESTEMATFSAKLESAASPVNEEKRLNFWLSSVKKFSEQMRQISLYTEDKKNSLPRLSQSSYV